MAVSRQSIPRSLRNKMLEEIQAKGLDIAEFVEERGEGLRGPWTVTHIETGAWFAIAPHVASGQITIEYFPDRNGGRISGGSHEILHAAANLPPFVEDWAQGIDAEQGNSDLWASVALCRDALTGADVFGDDPPMTPSESRAAEAAGRELGALLLASSIRTEQQVESIRSSVEYLAEASKRSGKKQWTMLFVATMTKLAFEGVIKSEEVRGAMSFVAGLLRGAWGAATKLLE